MSPQSTRISPALNGSSAIRRYERGDVVEIGDGIISFSNFRAVSAERRALSLSFLRRHHAPVVT